jgi:hypothetical protein
MRRSSNAFRVKAQIGHGAAVVLNQLLAPFYWMRTVLPQATHMFDASWNGNHPKSLRQQFLTLEMNLLICNNSPPLVVISQLTLELVHTR